MGKSTTNELLAEILIIKDLYICGCMNYAISQIVFENKMDIKYSKENWAKYEVLSETYIDNSVHEFLSKVDELEEKIKDNRETMINIIMDTRAEEFDNELFNEIMKEFYGGKDTLPFISAYDRFAADFNAIISEYFL